MNQSSDIKILKLTPCVASKLQKFKQKEGEIYSDFARCKQVINSEVFVDTM